MLTMGEAFIKDLLEMNNNGEINSIITTLRKYKSEYSLYDYKKRYTFFKRRKEAKRIEEFCEALNNAKHARLVWIPVLHEMPEEVMRDLFSIMIMKYDVTEKKKEANKDD